IQNRKEKKMIVNNYQPKSVRKHRSRILMLCAARVGQPPGTINLPYGGTKMTTRIDSRVLRVALALLAVAGLALPGVPVSASPSPASICTGPSFGAPTNFGAGINPYSVAVGDFNGDGKKDLAIANNNSNNVSVLLGTGSGSFGAPTNYPAGTNSRSVAVGDFDRNGTQDLAVANYGSASVSVLLGNVDGTF